MNKSTKRGSANSYLTHTKNNKGITLIALVITIIVMLILVGVTISMAVKGGLFNYAGNAVGDTRNALNDEQSLTNTDIIDYYVNRKPAVTSLKAYSTSLLNDEGVLEENTKYESGYNIAVIPKGFKVSDVASEQTIAGGLVIEDPEGNQFVWIPVRDGEFERTGWVANEPVGDKTLDEALETLDEEILKKEIAIYFGFNSIDEMIVAAGCSNYDELLVLAKAQYGVDNAIDMFKLLYATDSGTTTSILFEDYTENLSTDPTGEYENMIASVGKYGGFYIGRYEAGAQNEEGEKVARTNIANGTSEMVVKKDQYPYIYVGWANEDDYTTPIYRSGYNQGYGAVYLSYNMYTGDGYGVTSTLCYGVQWDATLRFVRDKYNVTNSTKWGNHNNSEFTFTGECSDPYSAGVWTFAADTTKPANSDALFSTGASEVNKAKNIYDLAGNVFELTMEAVGYPTWCVARGGCGPESGYECPASMRVFGGATNLQSHIGFRPTLYIK